jgi:hypothetical protein
MTPSNIAALVFFTPLVIAYWVGMLRLAYWIGKGCPLK